MQMHSIHLMIIFAFLLLQPHLVSAQSRKPIWYLPSEATEINGIALGPINSAVLDSPLPPQTVNGLHVEIGVGFFLILAPMDPFIGNDSEWGKERRRRADSAIRFDLTYLHRKIDINGIAVSPIGSVGLHTINGFTGSLGSLSVLRMNGLAINPFWNAIGSLKGVAISGLSNTSLYVSGLQASIVGNLAINSDGMQLGSFNKADFSLGVQFGVYNTAKSIHGLQIGLFNFADELCGLQLGIVNVTSNGWMPLVNWN